MAMDEGDLPFRVLVGPKSDISWAESAVAYASFYHLTAKGRTIAEAVKSMGAAIGQPDMFAPVTGEDAQRMYLGRLAKALAQNARDIEARLERAAASSPSLVLEPPKA
jgi:hypothetical protein